MKNKGFTLIEISLALVIISVLLGLSITLMKNLSRNNRYKAIKNRVENVRETIIGYVLEKGRFPFADIDNDGKEDPNYYTGKVPYKTLGLSKVEVSDSYGFMIDYDVAGGTGIQGSLANTSFRNICHQLGAYIDHNNTSPVLVTLDGGNSWIEVPFILMVRGIDKVYDSGNNDGDRRYYFYYNALGSAIDDIIVWDNFAELYNKLGCGKEFYTLYNQGPNSIWVIGGSYIGCEEISSGNEAYISKNTYGGRTNGECNNCISSSSCPISFLKCQETHFVGGNRDTVVIWNGISVLDN